MLLRNKHDQGFTLIELSIVLVIIGLVVGGVLVGQDLIKAAQVRAQISQIQELETQIVTFRGKYDCLPGDCATVTSFLASYSGMTVYNGDGDGLIRATNTGGTIYTSADCMGGTAVPRAGGGDGLSGEIPQLFLHLNAAVMGKYNTTTLNGTPPVANSPVLPLDIFGGRMLITCLNTSYSGVFPNFQSGTAIVIGGGNTHGTTRVSYILGFASTFPPILPPIAASAIDNKMDDGLIGTGRIGVLFPCPAQYVTNAPPPSTYSALASNCSVTLAKLIQN